jgi:hypothetical protein
MNNGEGLFHSYLSQSENGPTRVSIPCFDASQLALPAKRARADPGDLRAVIVVFSGMPEN